MTINATVPPPGSAPTPARVAVMQTPLTPVAPRPARTQAANTLDANWDKRLAKGIVAPDFTIDLHDHSAQAAFARLQSGLALAQAHGARLILLITGKPRGDNPRLPPTTRGVIRASILDWLSGSSHASNIAAIRNAHPRHGGAGALYVILRRQR